MSDFVTVRCTMLDCIFFTPEPHSRVRCRCTHPLMPGQGEANPCPLYQMDWKKKQDLLQGGEKKNDS